ncbi:hypothetical protein V8B97DRAFT_1914456 [Scleroderma yunnanense]
MSIPQPSAPGISYNILNLMNNIFATKDVLVTPLWLTIPIPITEPVRASIMLITPQKLRKHAWFLLKSDVVHFAHSLETIPFKLSFGQPGVYWCFKYMAHSSKYAGWNHIQDLNAQSLLEAFIGFEVPGKVLQGIQQINPRYIMHFSLSVYLSMLLAVIPTTPQAFQDN